LPSQLRGDPLSESWTHADGILGHIKIGQGGKADAALIPDATRLVITEAKIFSKLSAGVKNASYFNQAARNVACIAEMLSRANRNPAYLDKLGFYVLAPAETIGYGWFKKPLDKADIRQRVEKRVQAYEGEKDQWFKEWFLPVLDSIEIRSMGWESVLEYIGSIDSEHCIGLQDFFQKCLAFNMSAKQAIQD